MAASVEYRQEDISSGVTLDQIQVAFDSASENPWKPETKSIILGQDSGAAEDLLNSLNNITDYDWLLSPPRHPVPSLEIEEQIALTDHILISNDQFTSPESKLENPPADVTSTTNVSSSNGVTVKSVGTIRRPSPSRKASSTGSRAATPTARPTLTKPSRPTTPTSRATVPAATKPVAPIKRSTTPTPRPPVLAAKSKSTSRSSTPIQRPSVTACAKSASRSSTPTQRPAITASAKSASRSSTPTQRPSVTVSAKSASTSSTPTQLPSVTACPKSASRSSTPTQRPSVTASAKSASRSSTPTQRASVTASVKSASRSSTPTQRPSVTASAKSSRSSTPTQRPSVTASAKSASRSSTPTQRPSVTASAKPALRSSTPILRPSTAPGLAPDKSRPSNAGVKSGTTRGRAYSNGDDDVNPVLMGTQMVERVVNMRKLAPPREDRMPDQDNASGKLSVSQGNSGFGRSLSKKSFDMALRHLDIRRSMPGNMRATITKVPASSVYSISVRPESTKTRIISASDSPLATSSSASSDHSETGLASCYHQSSGGGGGGCEP